MHMTASDHAGSSGGSTEPRLQGWLPDGRAVSTASASLPSSPHRVCKCMGSQACNVCPGPRKPFLSHSYPPVQPCGQGLGQEWGWEQGPKISSQALRTRDSTEPVLWAGLCPSTSLLAPEWTIAVSLKVGGYPIKWHEPLKGGQHCVCVLEKNQRSAPRSPPTLSLPGKGVGPCPAALAFS